MKTAKTKSIVFLLVSAFMICSFAQQEPPIMNKVRKKYRADKTMKTAFELSIYWKIRDREEKKNGHLFLAPDNKFRVELGDAVWVCDGRTWWQYSKATEQVIIKYLLDVDLSHHPTRILTAHLNERKFTLKEKDGAYTVVDAVIDPEKEKSHASTIRLWIDSKSGIIHKLMVVDTKGNISTYTFKKTRIGEQIPEEMFRFEVPKDAKILDMRE
ncbi:MAG: hypothetical protein GF401_00810 [Chitinivibrionales bacterium]|nr:hypothetical protein [Chitinivibrionales bacterium]